MLIFSYQHVQFDNSCEALSLNNNVVALELKCQVCLELFRVAFVTNTMR